MATGVSKPIIRKAGGFTVSGLQEAYQKVSDILTATAAKNLKTVFMNAGMVGYAAVLEAAPYDEHHREKSPFMHVRDAVFLGAGDPGEPNVLLGVNYRKAPQALWLELGTVKMAPTPFFKQAVNSVKMQMGGIIAQGIKDAIEDAAK